jgi:hypothetical protein
VRALLHGARLLHVPEPLYLATERMGSLTRSDSGPIFAAFGRSAERLQQEAERRGDRAAARLLGRRARDVGSYGDYDRLSDALHRGRIRDAARLLWRLSARRYTWRRLGGALRRRLLPARF